MIQITRTHEICMGHRVVNHEGKCKNLHGHNYVFEFTVRPRQGLDSVGRVVDFSEVKSVLCEYLEKHWDHKTMLCMDDSLVENLNYISMQGGSCLGLNIIEVPFNPTAENIASFFLLDIAPRLTKDLDWYLYSIKLHETSKCSAYVELTGKQNLLERARKMKIPMPDSTYCTLQCGDERNCKCENETDEMKRKCKYNCDELPF